MFLHCSSWFILSWSGVAPPLSPQSSTQCQQTFPCCTVCLVWLALGAMEILWGQRPSVHPHTYSRHTVGPGGVDGDRHHYQLIEPWTWRSIKEKCGRCCCAIAATNVLKEHGSYSLTTLMKHMKLLGGPELQGKKRKGKKKKHFE